MNLQRKEVSIKPGDVVRILIEHEYHVSRTNPHSGSVNLRIMDANTNQRSFKRHSSAISLTPASTRGALFPVYEPFGNGLRKTPAPPVLADAADTSIFCNLELKEHVKYKRPEFRSVAKLRRDFEETKTAANAGLNEFYEEFPKSITLKEQLDDLTQRVATLNSEKESLSKRTSELTGRVSSLTAINSAHRHV